MVAAGAHVIITSATRLQCTSAGMFERDFSLNPFSYS